MNMVQLQYGNDRIRAFFNIDHKTGRIDNVEVINHLDQIIPLTERDLPHIVQLLNEEVQLAVLDAALFIKGGMTFDA